MIRKATDKSALRIVVIIWALTISNLLVTLHFLSLRWREPNPLLRRHRLEESLNLPDIELRDFQEFSHIFTPIYSCKKTPLLFIFDANSIGKGIARFHQVNFINAFGNKFKQSLEC